MSEQGLWPIDLTSKRERPLEPPPRDILESQAEDLAVKTKGVLKGRVERGSQGEHVTLDFLIVAPALEDYEYRLFKVSHKLVPPYPAKVVLDANDQREAVSPKDFRTLLAEIFSSEATRLLITQLLDLIDERGKKGSTSRHRRTG